MKISKIKRKERVIVAMSGGVDSAVSALLMKEQGHDVIGVTMQLWAERNRGGKSCCSHTDITDARFVADRLNIPHYVLNYEAQFKSDVVDYFATEYAQGRTPNPCVMCNSRLKFNHLMHKARVLNAEWVATGHYARLEGNPPALHRAHDRSKDQSYFLFGLHPIYLKKLKFPLQNLTKTEVRGIGKKFGLHNAEKRESQDICFVGKNSYQEFLQQNYKITPKLGYFKTKHGEIIGKHRGIHRYTVGQRKGLGIALGERRYVSAIDAISGDITLGDYEDLARQEVRIRNVNWLTPPPTDEVATVVTRYRGEETACKVISAEGGEYLLMTNRRVLASPGQVAVLYRGNQVLGGGFITLAKRASSCAVQRQSAS